jgi:hypothetical protein
LKSKLAMSLTASAAALLVTACGGGGGGADNANGAGGAAVTPADPTLQVSGTAATGAALSNAAVEVKCATGTGTATTATSGAYSVTITGGALPCMVEVKTTVNGATVSLHSVVEAGTLNEAEHRTRAVANVTPVTEMVVAQLSAGLPEDSFKGFRGDAITPGQLAAAVAAITTALKNAGVDLGTINPTKDDLVAATSGGKGNAYDQLLDALALKVDLEALKVVVNQIAAAAEAKSEDGLKDAMQAVSGGSLAGCPVAVSGKYRTADQFGIVRTRILDFKNMKLLTATATDSLTIAADAANGCVFTATGTVFGVDTVLKVVIGANGVGAYRSHQSGPNLLGGPDTVGYIFPQQSHSYSAVRGTWSVLQERLQNSQHVASQVTFGEERKVTSCEYDSAWNCVPGQATQTAAERTDGGIDVKAGDQVAATVYGYRAPNGAFAAFGSTNPTGTTSVPPNLIVASRLASLAVPAVGTVTKSWDTSISVSSAGTTGADPAPTSYTIQTADTANSTATRRRDSDGRIETLHYNQPITGVRTRDAGTFGTGAFAEIFQIPLTGMGVTLSVNAQPAQVGVGYLYDIAVVKP